MPADHRQLMLSGLPALAGTLAVAVTVGVAVAQAPTRPTAPAEPLVLRGVTVVDVTDGTLFADRAVFIEGNRITAIEPSAQAAAEDGARVIDGTDGYLIPGLWDMHAHALGSMRAFAPMLQALIANGVTGIRDPQRSSLELAAMIEPALRAGAMPGRPRLIVAGNQIDGSPPAWPGAQVPPSADTVRVAPPTGETDTDRASILRALEEVQPGGAVQFAAGTYLVGEVVRIETPGIALLGHADGTTLRGCDPDAYEQAKRDFAEAGASGLAAAAREVASRCGMLELTGGNVTVRGLTFEHSRMGLILGCCQLELMFRNSEGGYLIEGNTFRNSLNGIRPFTTERTVIRGNRFVNTFHAISGAGGSLHVLDNQISVPEPAQEPSVGHPSFALALGPLPRRAAEFMGVDANGEGNVIAGNRIEGHPDGILITLSPGTSFRDNVIRDNTIVVERVPIPPSGARPYIVDVTDEGDSTIVGIPLTVYPMTGPPGSSAQDAAAGTFEDNLIEGNRLIGAEGVGMAIRRGSGNRIVGNTISGIERREPFPGNTVLSSESWREANGSAIWLSPDSDGNEVVGNGFEDVAGAAVFLEGDSNRVELSSVTDSVRDLGSGNEIIAAPALAPGDPASAQAGAESALESRFVQVRGIRMHYLDFGGSGLPVIFLHGSHGDARGFGDFAPRFADRFRVLVPDRRGYGETESVDWGHGTAAQAEDILGFMDALGLQRAALIGNVAGPTGLMTYLGERHPDRLAGIVYLAHMAPEVAAPLDPDVAEFWEMASRTACDWDEETRRRRAQRDGYRPHFIDDPDLRIDVPALSFANAEGARYPGDFDFVDVLLQQVETGAWCDATAKEYFSALAADPARATELRSRLGDLTGRANLEAFERAFGPRMTVVRLEVPAVSGYEYRQAPDLIYSHIRRFLETLEPEETERGRSLASRTDSATLRTITVDDHAVRILSRGLDRSGAGPVVVFEGGSSTPLEAWSAVVEELDEDVSFIAYDPPGIGESRWDGVRPTPDRVAQRMRSVLAEAGARPPYVLVGHSWAGWVVRAFEGRYPEDVGGMVLIDPTPSVSEFMAALAEVGAGDQGLVEFARLGERITADAPEPIRVRQRVISDYLEDRSDPDVPDAPSVPVVVLVAGRYDSTELPEQLRPPFDVKAFFAALQRRKAVAPVEWVNAAPRGSLIYAADSPHCIHCTDPGLVAEAIRRVVVQAAPRS